MNSIVYKEAVRYSDDLENSKIGLQNYQQNISSKLYNFRRDRDKIYFISVVRECINDKKSKHKDVCQKNPCYTVENFDTMLFALEQEYESIQEHYTPDIDTSQEFTTSERIDLSNKIDSIISNLSEIKIGQEVLFDELDTLRQYFNIDKKSWFQLLKGKLIDVCAVGLIDKTIANEVYNGLANEVSNVTNYITTQI